MNFSNYRCVLTASIGLALLLPSVAYADPNAITSFDKLVVTASGFEQVIRQAPASISVIQRDDLKTQPFHGVAEALSGIEGVDVGGSVDKTGAPSISIRGMPSDYTLVLIDGRRQNTSGNITPNAFGGTSNNFIPPMFAIERIEVIRGPMSTLYGSDAIGGVINIITRKPSQQWQGAVGFDMTVQQDRDFGDLGGINGYFSGALVPDKLALSVWGNYFQRQPSSIKYQTTDGTETTPIMGANPVNYVNYTIGSRLTAYLNDNHDITLEAQQSRQTYDNSKGQLGTLGTGGYSPEQRYNRDYAVLAWNARWDRGNLDTSIMQNTTETIGRVIPKGVVGEGQARQLENKNTVLDTKWSMPWGNHTSTMGGQWMNAKMQDGIVSEAFSFNQWALFLENEWQISERFTNTIGLRYDRHDTFGDHISPRIYGVWNVSEQWVVKGGVSQGYKTPRLEQLTAGINGFGNQGTLPLIGTPNLIPETSTSSELGVYYANEAGLSANVTFFNNQFKDKIATGIPVFNCSFVGSLNRPDCVDVGFFPNIDTFSQAQNIDKATTRGGEFSVKVPLSSAWRLTTNYTYTTSEQKSGVSKGLPLANTPKHSINSAINWQVNSRLNAFVRGQYQSSRFRGAGVAQDELGDFSRYSVFHLGGTFQATENISLNAAIYNLFDKNFIDYQPYISNQKTQAISYANRFANSEEGRRLWVSLNVEFK